LANGAADRLPDHARANTPPYPFAMTTQPDNGPELERQRITIEAAFRDGWRPMGAGEPRVLTERNYAEVQAILGRGGWTGLDQATIDAVRDGAQPGDPLPPLQAHPYIDDVLDAEVIITGVGPQQQVAVLFSHRDFPGARFGHRFSGYDPALEKIELKEEIETGALHRMMQNQPPADSTGVTWTTWGSPPQ
jgi:hypothetical protein